MSTINSNQGALLAQKFLRSNAADATGVQNRVSSGLHARRVGGVRAKELLGEQCALVAVDGRHVASLLFRG